MNEIEIRPAKPDDARTLASLRAAFLAEIAAADPNSREFLTALEDYFTKNLNSGAFTAFLAVAEGKIVATSGLILHEYPPSAKNLSGRTAYVMNMYTLPDWRGRGLAAELLRRLIDLARAKGIRFVSLHAIPKAAEIYRRAGFVEVDSEMKLEL